MITQEKTAVACSWKTEHAACLNSAIVHLDKVTECPGASVPITVWMPSLAQEGAWLPHLELFPGRVPAISGSLLHGYDTVSKAGLLEVCDPGETRKWCGLVGSLLSSCCLHV